MTHQLPRGINRRTFLRAGATSLASATFLGTAACSNNRKTPAASGSGTVIDYFYPPCVVGKNPYSLNLIQSTFNMKFKTIYMENGNDYATKFVAFLAGGNIPDVMAINGPDMLQKFAAQGAFAEIDKDLIQQYAPKYSAGIDKNVPIAWASSLYNGKNYGFPGIGGPGAGLSPLTEWRTDLLHKAGITTVPDTLDEVEAAFAALKKIGVYGMSDAGTSYYAAFMTIFGAHGVLPMHWHLKDGKIINGAVAPEAKDALALLASWFKKGYLDPEFMSTSQQGQKWAAGKVGMQDYGGAGDTDAGNPNSALAVARKTNPDAQIAFGYPPEGPGGRGSWAWGTAGWPVAFSPQMAKDTGKLKEVLNIWDTIWSDNTLTTKLAIGEEGTTYKLLDKTKGVAGGWEWIGKYVDPVKQQAEGFSAGSPVLGAPNWDISMDLNQPNVKARTLMQTYGKYGQADIFQNSMTVPGSGQYMTDLQALKVKAYAQIIAGASPVSSFDDFVKQWNTQGGTALQKAANTLYEQTPH